MKGFKDVQIRWSAKEYDRLSINAGSIGIPLTAWIRQVCHEALIADEFHKNLGRPRLPHQFKKEVW